MTHTDTHRHTHTHTHTDTHTHTHTQELIPITKEMVIPFEFHRYIVGQRGREIRSLMEEHNVNIVVPTVDKNVSVHFYLAFISIENSCSVRSTWAKKVLVLENKIKYTNCEPGLS